jgi:phosphoribosylformylglycinamidine (FGAM) synthase-like amidotransferase family enzyme
MISGMVMDNVRVLVLRAAGVNCDLETGFAFELAGAQAQRVHINRLIENPSMLDDFAILVFPGGFSYGDDVAAGKILANQVVHHLVEPIRRFIDSGRLALGICNGFQVLLKAGFLPGWDGAVGGKSFAELPVSITDNDRPQYECRWVYLEPASDRCVFLTPGQRLCVPMAHGEGKIVTRDAEVLTRLQNENFIAFRATRAVSDQPQRRDRFDRGADGFDGANPGPDAASGTAHPPHAAPALDATG